MQRHFMSRAGAVAVLVSRLEHLDAQHEKAGHAGERSENRSQRDTLRRLIPDVRAERVDAVAAPGIEIVIKD